MNHPQSFVHARTVALPLCSVVDDEMLNLAGTQQGPDTIAQAINDVRTHGLVQLLCTNNENTGKLNDEDYLKATLKAFRTLLDDIQLEGERIHVESKVSKTNILIITLRREEPSKDDTPVPPSA